MRRPRTEGPYLPPGKLEEMEKGLDKNNNIDSNANEDFSSEEFQRISWEALRRSLNGLINKVNTSNIAEIVEDLIELNLVRGRGLLVKVTIISQAQSPIHTPVYAAMFAVLNTKFPLIGELLINRLIIEFRSSFAKNDKEKCYSSLLFLANLVNQRVLHDICILQILMLLLERPTDDSIEIAIKLIESSGKILSLQSPKPFNAIFERLRTLLQSIDATTTLSKRVQYKIEGLFSLRRQGFSDPIESEELDLVEEDEQQTHTILLDSTIDPEAELDSFVFDRNYAENEAEYTEIKRSILGDEVLHDDDHHSGDHLSDDADDEGENKDKVDIVDLTAQEAVHFRKTIYLTIMSSLDFEECGHKLLQMNIPQERWYSLVQMIIDCTSNEKIYLKFYGFLSERFCLLDLGWRSEFEIAFVNNYQSCGVDGENIELDTGKLRNIVKLFSHLLTKDAISWAVLECIILRPDSTTSTQRIWVKLLFKELGAYYGESGLWDRINVEDVELTPYFSGIFPAPPATTAAATEDNEDLLDHLRFCVNYFTAIGLPSLARIQREYLCSSME